MEAAFIKINLTPDVSLKKAIEAFFEKNTLDSAQEIFWKMFQCWAVKECNLKAEISDKEVALFFDQLIDLVAAAYILHEANRVSANQQEGTAND